MQIELTIIWGKTYNNLKMICFRLYANDSKVFNLISVVLLRKSIDFRLKRRAKFVDKTSY